MQEMRSMHAGILAFQKTCLGERVDGEQLWRSVLSSLDADPFDVHWQLQQPVGGGGEVSDSY
jgi:hypothetical protein